MTSLFTFAIAATQAAAPGGMSSLTPFLLEVALIVVAFYFVLVRPQQKQRKQHEEALRALKKGDEILTSGGIVGEVVFIKESKKDGQSAPTMEDQVTIKSGETRLIVERGRIARVQGKSSDPGGAS